MRFLISLFLNQINVNIQVISQCVALLGVCSRVYYIPQGEAPLIRSSQWGSTHQEKSMRIKHVHLSCICLAGAKS